MISGGFLSYLGHHSRAYFNELLKYFFQTVLHDESINEPLNDLINHNLASNLLDIIRRDELSHLFCSLL